MLYHNETQKQTMSVVKINELTSHVFQVFLRTTSQKILDFKAGQYLTLNLPESNEQYAFSIASSPFPHTNTLELHIQCAEENLAAKKIITHLKRYGTIQAVMAFGCCCLDTSQLPDSPLVFIAAATGFSQIKSMIELMKTCSRHPLFLYWGGVSPESFYMSNLPVEWDSAGLVEYHPVLSNVEYDNLWNGRFGLLFEAVIEDSQRFRDANFFISGSPNMVYATVDALVQEGFSEGVMHSDVFEYAPR